MSLDDRLNPNDGSPIDKVDNALFELNKKLAEKWQDKTGYSKKALEGILYAVSFAALGTYTFQMMSPLMAVPAIASGVKAAYPESRPKSTIEEEMAAEMSGIPGKMHKVITHSLYLLGFSLTVHGVRIATGILGADIDYSNAMSSFVQGIGLVTWVTADYMSKSDIGDPPPKKKVLDRLKDLARALVPRPVPAYSVGSTPQ